MSGFYLNELLLRLLPRADPHPELYLSYARALESLAGEALETRALRLFEKRLLDALGYGIDYTRIESTGEAVREDGYYYVRAERGVEPAGDGEGGAHVYRGAHLLALAAETLEDGSSLAAARELLAHALRAAGGPRAGQPHRGARAARFEGPYGCREAVMTDSTAASSIALGVNVDHVATLRQARRVRYPDPLHAALAAEQNGADSITMHLREDRRHIQDEDVERFPQSLQTRMNLELAAVPSMVAIAVRIRPADVCLVPERREEITTEGGLDVAWRTRRCDRGLTPQRGRRERVAVHRCRRRADPSRCAQRRAGHRAAHGSLCRACGAAAQAELERLRRATEAARRLGLTVNAGHGLHYHNVAR